MVAQDTSVAAGESVSGPAALVAGSPGDYRDIRRELDDQILIEVKDDPVERRRLEDQLTGE